MKRFATLSTVLALAAALGCGNDPAAPTPPTATGTWHGTSGAVTLHLVLTQTGATVVGTGTTTVNNVQTQWAVTGTFSDPSLTLVMAAQGLTPAAYTGSLSRNTVTGTLNGTSFPNVAMNLTRQ